MTKPSSEKGISLTVKALLVAIFIVGVLCSFLITGWVFDSTFESPEENPSEFGLLWACFDGCAIYHDLHGYDLYQDECSQMCVELYEVDGS